MTPVTLRAHTPTVTISSRDLSTLLMATLALASGARPSKRARLEWMTVFVQISKQAEAQLPAASSTQGVQP